MDEQKPVRGILWLTLLLGRHTAFLSISPSTLTHDAGEMMSGPLDGATWHTDVELSATNNASLPPGDISMDLDALPDAWTLMRDAIQASQPLLTLDERPTDIGWSMTTGTPSIVARYDTSPSTSTMLAFANAAGIFDETPLTLPDGSIAEELGPPIQELMTSGTIRTTSSSSTKLLIEQNTVFLGPPDADNRTNTQCISSPGIFALSRRLIQMHFPALDFGVRAFVEKGHLAVETCDSQ